jgi:hypothetical protein
MQASWFGNTVLCVATLLFGLHPLALIERGGISGGILHIELYERGRVRDDSAFSYACFKQ